MDYFKPKAFVFENVRGILSSNKGEDFKIIYSSFEALGYKLYWRILNAADYGVPQQRERLFLVGIRKDLPVEFHFPLPTHGPDSLDNTKYVSAFEAIQDLCDENEIVPPYGGKYGHLLPDIPPGENYRYYTEEMGHPEPQFAWRSKFSNFLYKMHPDEVCRTIIAYQGKYDGPFHWKNRKCTIDELKRLQGFPSNFLINHSYTESVKQIGNSVCPPVAYQLGRALRHQIEGLVEFKVDLIENGQKLSFDKLKGTKARKSRAKKVVRYEDLIQPDLFGWDEDNKVDYPKFEMEYILHEKQVTWLFKDGELDITFGVPQQDNNPITSIVLSFFGAVTSRIKKVRAFAYDLLNNGEEIRVLWSEIHKAINKTTTFDSLMPLYGHFTEPYPKFKVLFQSKVDTVTARFQEMALKDSILNDVQPYSIIGDNIKEVESYLKKMREIGYDIRTNNTNKTIPKHYFRICYPFTMPVNINSDTMG